MTDPTTLLFSNWRKCVATAYPAATTIEIDTALEFYRAAYRHIMPLVPAAPDGATLQAWQMAATNALLSILHTLVAGEKN